MKSVFVGRHRKTNFLNIFSTENDNGPGTRGEPEVLWGGGVTPETLIGKKSVKKFQKNRKIFLIRNGQNRIDNDFNPFRSQKFNLKSLKYAKSGIFLLRFKGGG